MKISRKIKNKSIAIKTKLPLLICQVANTSNSKSSSANKVQLIYQSTILWPSQMLFLWNMTSEWLNQGRRRHSKMLQTKSTQLSRSLTIKTCFRPSQKSQRINSTRQNGWTKVVNVNTPIKRKAILNRFAVSPWARKCQLQDWWPRIWSKSTIRSAMHDSLKIFHQQTLSKIKTWRSMDPRKILTQCKVNQVFSPFHHLKTPLKGLRCRITKEAKD